MADARKTAVKALIRVEQGGYSNLVLDNALSSSELSDRDTAFASALFYGVLERKITLDYIIRRFSKLPPSKISAFVMNTLRIGVYQLLYMDKIPDNAAVDQSVRIVKNSRDSKASGFVNGLLRSVIRAGESVTDFSKLKGDERLSVEYSVPVWLARHLRENYGYENTIGILSHSFGRPTLNFKVNTLKTDTDSFIESFGDIKVTKSSVCEDFVEVEGLGSIENCQQFKDGLFHVQDTASGLCCKALGVKAGERVLDLCAAPGGKSFTLAQMMQNEGELLSLDLYEHKIGLIKSGAERLGINIINSFINDADSENDSLGQFDKILFDLPCSGLGIINRKPEIRYKDVVILDIFPDLQYSIICKNIDRLKKGGVAVFSTCTLNPAENEQMVKRFLDEHPDFEPYAILPELKRVHGEPENMITLMPHIHGTDGFFISAFRRR